MNSKSVGTVYGQNLKYIRVCKTVLQEFYKEMSLSRPERILDGDSRRKRLLSRPKTLSTQYPNAESASITENALRKRRQQNPVRNEHSIQIDSVKAN